MTDMMKQVASCGIVPVIKIDDVEKAVPLAKALIEGGINFIEITFRTVEAPEAIRRVAAQVPEMVVGAGTIINVEQLKLAVECGAKFIVSPGLDVESVSYATQNNITILPGVLTPTEIIAGLKLGLTTFKFFPAESYGGLSTIKALCAPFPQISFVPTGGISEKNAAPYFKFNKVTAVGGSWMAPSELIEAGDFAEITRRTVEAVALMKCSREAK